VLHINGEAVAREPVGFVEIEGAAGIEQVAAFRETLQNGASYITLDRIPMGELDNTRVYVVPEGNYFFLGDDRDNSADSRVPSVVGYVPHDKSSRTRGPHHARRGFALVQPEPIVAGVVGI
jgi:signal peptidase I